MNIFYVDSDPAVAARSLVDSHVVKMVLESAQLLSTVHRVLDGTATVVQGAKRKKTVYTLPDERETILYAATHVNHPSAVWCRSSVSNYQWLFRHFQGLLGEYTYRYGRVHKCGGGDGGQFVYTLSSPPTKLKEYTVLPPSPPPPAMPTEFIISDSVVDNYRNYYNKGKRHLHRYTKRHPPSWLITERTDSNTCLSVQ